MWAQGYAYHCFPQYSSSGFNFSLVALHFTQAFYTSYVNQDRAWLSKCIVYAANCNLKFSITIPYKRVKYSNKKKLIRKQMSSSGKEGLQILDWSEINIYSINIHISCYKLHEGLKYNVIVDISQPLESEETAGRGFVIGCPSWLLPEYSSSYMLERGSRCYQVTAQECDLKRTLTHTQRLVIGSLWWVVLNSCLQLLMSMIHT